MTVFSLTITIKNLRELQRIQWKTPQKENNLANIKRDYSLYIQRVTI